jgi:hypothetical protein
MSSRRPSASRRIFWAARWSSQKPGSSVSPSSWATRRSFVPRSKPPRGRPDPIRQLANGGRVHSVPGLEVLQEDRAELDQSQGGLAPGDDGVHAGTVGVVGTDTAVAITVECRCVTARPAVTFTGDEIDERRFLGLLQLNPHSGAGAGLGAARKLARAIPPSRAREFAAVSHVDPLRPRGKSVSVARISAVAPGRRWLRCRLRSSLTHPQARSLRSSRRLALDARARRTQSGVF